MADSIQTAPPLHSQALKGFSAATTYDKHRPSYPAAAVTSLLTNLGVAKRVDAKILDLGAGTGKFTELLAARDEHYEIIAVEPHAEMRGVLEEKVRRSEAMQGVKVLDGGAYDMSTVKDEEMTAVVVAQAFHWFADVRALQEIWRVLEVGGGLGLIWNFDDVNSRIEWPATTHWEARIRAISRSYEPGTSFSSLNKSESRRHSAWPAAFESQSFFSTPLGEDVVHWSVKLTREQVWERIATISHFASLSEGLKGEKEVARKKVMEAMSSDDCVADLDEEGRVTLHGRTVFYWTQKLAGYPV